MVHWTKTENADNIRKRISEHRKGKLLGNIFGFRKGKPSWNKNLPKEQQPRYGKPVSQKQIANMREIGRKGHHSTWLNVEKEWSPRATELQRIKALVRDKYSCVECGSEQNIVVHHIQWFDIMKDRIHELNNLQTLCRKCHVIKHHKIKKEKQASKQGR